MNLCGGGSINKKIILASSVLGGILLSFPFLAVLAYILLPFVLSALTGMPSPCDAPAGADSPSSPLYSPLYQLCNSAKSFLGVTSMLGIILFPFIAALFAIIPSIDIFASQKLGGEKVKWLAVVWVVPAIGAFAYYWLVKRKE